MPNDIQLNTNDWRNNGFVVNVLMEIPIIGSFFKIQSLTCAFHDAGKCVAALAGGTTAMMMMSNAGKCVATLADGNTIMIMPKETDQIPIHIIKTTSSMIAGMTIGKVIYNGASMLYHYTATNEAHSNNTLNNNDEELQPTMTHVMQ